MKKVEHALKNLEVKTPIQKNVDRALKNVNHIFKYVQYV